MQNRILAAAATLGVALSPIMASAETTFSTDPFTDVPENSQYYTAIEYLRTNNVLKGYEDGTFKPEARINRAEFVKLIANPFILDTQRLNDCMTEEMDEDDQTVFFPDVARDSWYAREVCLAKTKKLISGYPDGTFQPGQYISFVESAKIIVSTFALQRDPEPENEKWFMPYVEKLSEVRAIPTTVSTFDQTITRGEMAEMLYRLKTNTTNRASKTSGQLR